MIFTGKWSVKIVEVIADSSLTGGPRHVFDLVSGFKDAGYRFDVICPAGWLADQLEEGGLAKVNRVKIKSALDRDAIAGVKSLLQEIKPDVVHAHGTRAGILAARAMAKDSIPLVYTEHRWTADFHLKNPIRQWLQLRALRGVGRRAAKMIGVSQAVSQFLTEQKISPPEKTVTVHNGIALPVQIKDAVHTDTPVIGSVGSLIPVKNFSLLLTAFAQVLKSFPQAKLEIVGEGEEARTLKQLVIKLGIEGRVSLLGRVDDLAAKYLSWDIFVSTSTTESFGLAIAEAMAAGLPVVATDFAAARELITEDVGYRVDFKDADIAKAVVRLLWEEDLRARMGEAGRHRIEANFSQYKMVRDLEKVYREAAAASVSI